MASWSCGGAPPQPAGGTWEVLFSEAASLPGNASGFHGSGGGVGPTAAMPSVLWPCLSWQKPLPSYLNFCSPMETEGRGLDFLHLWTSALAS